MSVTCEYETVIGLEVHAQLLTRTKMYCSCATDYQDAPPNTHVCPVCLGMPGSLPVANREAIQCVMTTALALHCELPEHTRFDRKNYFYPDLMKGYQISQYDAPIGKNGWLDIEVDGHTKRIGITRVHLEEDVAKSLHMGGYSLIDVNRAGVPLMETVSEPDMRSPEEAREYLVRLRALLRYLGVSTGNMEEGSFRCDANISLRPVGSTSLGAKIEIKNMNSFRGVYHALKYEQIRQAEILAAGGTLRQETRGWLDADGTTVLQRTKEFAEDYRYFPEPDLPPVVLDRSWVTDVAARMPELPDERRSRFVAECGVPASDANTLASSRAFADFFDECVSLGGVSKGHAISKWLLGDISRLVNADGVEICDCRLTPRGVVELVDMIDRNLVGGPAAKTVLEEMYRSGKEAKQVLEDLNLGQMRGNDELLAAVNQVIGENPKAVADFRAGKEQSLTFLTGQLMRLTRGRADPATSRRLLTEQLQDDCGAAPSDA
ncbi:MAG: Asp-tRNA(Asn)/Glu-tRNA(Gln) amidotransferase subunit GatB [Dehalococcoidia bacterium]|nr:Asp-tRNA(Asn)/Glu-tRNA(Gln) amidotransferase subunit GatB [Dehalococcoidia bacterium]